MRKLGLVVLGLFFSGTASAADDSTWTSNLELGFVQTTGNTEVSSLNTKAKAIRDVEEWRLILEANALSVSDKVSTTAEKYDVSAQGDWKTFYLGYLFGRIGFDTDRFGGFKRRSSETLGYGFDILERDDKQWNAEIGGGARQTELTSGEKTSDAVVRASTVFNWKISNSASFMQSLKTEGGNKGFVSKAVTSLLNQVSGNLSSKIAFTMQHTSNVPVGTKKLNTETAVSLVFSY